MSADERPWQRLDHWLWCARFRRHRAECSRWVEEGLLRVNCVPVAKSHQRRRVGDVLTLPFPGQVREVEGLALAERRGPAPLARGLYREVVPAAGGCGTAPDGSYPPRQQGQRGQPTRSA